MEGTLSEIRMFAGNFAPKSWAFCAGQLLPINSNQALFSLIGTTYGGNGTTNFALPNLCGRVPVGTGVTDGGINAYQLGEINGSTNVTVLPQNMPQHTHMVNSNPPTLHAYSDGGDTGNPTNAHLAGLNDLYSTELADTSLAPINSNVTVGLTGGSQAISIQQPYLGMNYIICLNGVYPSRQ